MISLLLLWWYFCHLHRDKFSIICQLFVSRAALPHGIIIVGREACSVLAAREGNKSFSQAWSLSVCVGCSDRRSSLLSSHGLQGPERPRCSARVQTRCQLIQVCVYWKEKQGGMSALLCLSVFFFFRELIKARTLSLLELILNASAYSSVSCVIFWSQCVVSGWVHVSRGRCCRYIKLVHRRWNRGLSVQEKEQLSPCSTVCINHMHFLYKKTPLKLLLIQTVNYFNIYIISKLSASGLWP